MAEVEKQRKKATRSSVNIVHGGKCEKTECKQFSRDRERESKRQTMSERERERGGNSAVGELGVCSVGVSAGSTKNGS